MDKIIAGCDIGLDGGLSDGTTHLSMPTSKIEVKPARYVFDLDQKGKKQYIKSGPNKGNPKQKLKSAAKHIRELDVQSIYNLLKNIDIVIFEQPGNSMGNAARTTATTNRNYGKLLACATLAGCQVETVAPHKWKKDLSLSKDKQQSIDMAQELTGASFITPRGKLLDGPAEAFLIRHAYIQNIKEQNETS